MDLALLKETIREIFKTGNNKLLIERFSFQDRIDVFSLYIGEVEELLDEFDYNMEYQSLLFASAFTKEEVLQNFDRTFNDANIYLKVASLLTEGLDEEIIMQHIRSIDDASAQNLIATKLSEKNKVIFLKQVDLTKYDNLLESLKYDDSKLEILNNLDPDDQINQAIMISLLESDEEKLKRFEKITNMECLTQIICSLDSDKQKISALEDESMEFEYFCRCDIIKSLKSDEKKIEFLSKENLDLFSKGDIIKSLSNDEVKLNLLKGDIGPHYIRYQVYCALEHDESKIAALNDIYLKETEKAEIISALKSDEKKIKILNSKDDFIFSSDDRRTIICSLERIEDRLVFFSELTFAQITDLVNHDDEILKLKEINFDLVSRYAQELNLNYDNLSYLVYKFGYEILRNATNQNIINLINLSNEDFKKVIDLFDLKSFVVEKHDIDNVLNAIIQREFRIEQHEIVHKFNFLEGLIEAKDKERFRLELLKIVSEIDFVSILMEKIINLEQLIEGVFEIENKIYLDILHDITNQYIAKQREYYTAKRMPELFSSLPLEKSYEKNALIKQLFKLENIDLILNIINSVDKTQLSNHALEFLENQESLIKVIKFKQGSQNLTKDELNSLKTNLNHLSEILNVLYLQKKLNFLGEINLINNVKYGIPNVSNRNIISIIRELDINAIKNNILTDDFKMYDKLTQVMKKYKFISWGTVFESILDKVGLVFDSSLKASFINNFYSFYSKLEENLENGQLKTISLTTLLDEVLVYGSSSSRYRYMLDKQDYNLICENPGPNSASKTTEERLKEMLIYIKKLYGRKYITVPTINQNIKLKNSKNINISVGITSDTSNLTLGERTGACMRIGGAGNSLFDFCIENENGFHVIFRDPETNEFVSRVSGFRNGNTVFLNQLRFSCTKKYNNKDLIEACTFLSNYFIEQTKDSKFPINNVVISPGYVMEGNETISLGTFSIKEGFEYFYSDVKSEVVLLSTSKQDKSLVPVSLGPEKTEKYEVLRQKVSFEDNPLTIHEKISRIQLTNQLLNGNELDDLIIPEYAIDNLAKLYYGEDWYVLLDQNNNIIDKYIMHRDDRNMELANQEISTLGLDVSKVDSIESVLNGGIKK